jgi:hypothetical protein
VQGADFFPTEGVQPGGRVALQGVQGTITCVHQCGARVMVRWDGAANDAPDQDIETRPKDAPASETSFVQIPNTTVLDDVADPSSAPEFVRQEAASLTVGAPQSLDSRAANGVWRPKTSFRTDEQCQFAVGGVYLAPICDGEGEDAPMVRRYRRITVKRLADGITATVVSTAIPGEWDVPVDSLRHVVTVECAPAHYIVRWVHAHRQQNPTAERTAFTVPSGRLRRLPQCHLTVDAIRASALKHFDTNAFQKTKVLRDADVAAYFSLRPTVAFDDLRIDCSGAAGSENMLVLQEKSTTLTNCRLSAECWPLLKAMHLGLAEYALAQLVIEALTRVHHELVASLAPASSTHLHKLVVGMCVKRWYELRASCLKAFVIRLTALFEATERAANAVRTTNVGIPLRAIDQRYDEGIANVMHEVLPQLDLGKLKVWHDAMSAMINKTVLKVATENAQRPSQSWLNRINNISGSCVAATTNSVLVSRVVEDFDKLRQHKRGAHEVIVIDDDTDELPSSSGTAPSAGGADVLAPASQVNTAIAARARAPADQHRHEIDSETQHTAEAQAVVEARAAKDAVMVEAGRRIRAERDREQAEAERKRPKQDLVYSDPTPLPAPIPVSTTLSDSELLDVISLSEFLATYNVPLGLELQPDDFAWATLEAALHESHPAGDLGCLVTSLVWHLMGSDLLAKCNMRVLGLTANNWDVHASYASELLRRIILALDGSVHEPDAVIGDRSDQGCVHHVFKDAKKMLFTEEERTLAVDLAHIDFLDLSTSKKLLALNLLTSLCLSTSTCRDHLDGVESRREELVHSWNDFTTSQEESKRSIVALERLQAAWTGERAKLLRLKSVISSGDTIASADLSASSDDFQRRIDEARVNVARIGQTHRTAHSVFTESYVRDSMMAERRLRPCGIGRDRHYRTVILFPHVRGLFLFCPSVDDFMCTWLHGPLKSNFDGRGVFGYPAVPSTADEAVARVIAAELKMEWPDEVRSQLRVPGVAHPPVVRTRPTRERLGSDMGSPDALPIGNSADRLGSTSGATASGIADGTESGASIPISDAVASQRVNGASDAMQIEAAALPSPQLVEPAVISATKRVGQEAAERIGTLGVDITRRVSDAQDEDAMLEDVDGARVGVRQTTPDDADICGSGARAASVSVTPIGVDCGLQPKIGYRAKVLWDHEWADGVVQNVKRKKDVTDAGDPQFELEVRYADGDVGEADFPEDGIEVFQPTTSDMHWFRFDDAEDVVRYRKALMTPYTVREKALEANLKYYGSEIKRCLDQPPSRYVCGSCPTSVGI